MLFGSCSLCHQEGGSGVPRFPDDHEGRRDDLCTACHTPATEAPEASPATAAEALASDSGDAANGQALYEEGCAICHGPTGEGTAIAPQALDDVAYVRFASVYRNFREAKDFEAVLDELAGEDEGRPAAVRK